MRHSTLSESQMIEEQPSAVVTFDQEQDKRIESDHHNLQDDCEVLIIEDSPFMLEAIKA